MCTVYSIYVFSVNLSTTIMKVHEDNEVILRGQTLVNIAELR